MRIIVYTIMKNELKNIESWLENIKDADGIYVLDTGSTDGSYEKMLEMGKLYPQLHVEQNIYDDFRFDIARNDNLAMVPNMDDIICWTIDLDERFTDNWYEKTKRVVENNPNFYKLNYWYACQHDQFGNVIDKHIYDKCHQRIGASWSEPIHEILTYGDYESNYNEGNILIDENEIFIHHYQNLDTNRSPQYIKLLKERLEIDKYDIEAMHHLTTEYGKLGDEQAKLDTLLLQYSRGIICNCSWMECICGNIASELETINSLDAEMWYKKAIEYNPQLLTYYLKLAQYLSYRNRADEALNVLTSIPSDVYQQEEWKELVGAHSWLLDDTYGIAYSWKGDYETAIAYFISAKLKAEEENDINGLMTSHNHIEFCKEKIYE